MRKTLFGTLTLALSVAATVQVASPMSALARTQPASAGQAVTFADQSCFATWFTGVRNDCSTTRSWNVPLTIDHEGGHWVNVTAYRPSSSTTVGCSSAAVNREITSVSSGGLRYLAAIGSPQIIPLATAHVPASGSMYVTCNIGPGARINSVDFNP